jgi:L-serine dehydratase
MAVSVFDLFSIGIGPSSSHTVVRHLGDDGLLPEVARVRIELYGSLGATGAGHGTPGAVMLGLEGCAPETVDPRLARARVDEISGGRKLLLAGTHTVDFDDAADIVLSLRAMEFHSNGLVFLALGEDGAVLSRRVYYSVGGGFVVDEDEAQSGTREDTSVPYPFSTAAELVALATEHDCSIAELMARNEAALGREPDLRARAAANLVGDARVRRRGSECQRNVARCIACATPGPFAGREA